MTSRGDREIEHGRMLAAGDSEKIWGWGTPAGRLRAERRARLIGQSAGLRPGVKVLEIGCGTGNFTKRFAETGASITACDISPDLIECANQRGLDDQHVCFMCIGFEDCMAQGPFDAVIGSSILHHLDLLPTLGKIHNLLRPGGVLSFAEPNMLNPQIFFERHFRSFFPQVSSDETAYTKRQMKKDLKAAGFVDIQIMPFDWLHPATPSVLIPFISGLGSSIENIPLLREFSGSLLIVARHSL